MRVTFKMADMAARAHMPMVRANSDPAKLRRHDDLERGGLRAFDGQEAQSDAGQVSQHRTHQRLQQDDEVDVSGRRAERPQRGELVQVVLRRGVERLGDDDDADDHAQNRAGDQRHACTRLEQPVVGRAGAELGVGQHLGVLQPRDQRRLHRFDVGARRGADQDVGRLLLTGARQLAGLLQRGEHVGQRGERADARGHGLHRHPLLVDLGLLADLGDAEIGEVRAVDGHRRRRIELGDAAVLDVPGLQAAAGPVGADQHDRLGAALRLAPGGEADHQLLGALDAGGRQYRVGLAADQQRGVVEALGADRDHPQVGLGLVEHDRDGPLRAEVEAALHRHQHHREHDADQRHDEAEAIMEQVAESELGGHHHAQTKNSDDLGG